MSQRLPHVIREKKTNSRCVSSSFSRNNTIFAKKNFFFQCSSKYFFLPNLLKIKKTSKRSFTFWNVWFQPYQTLEWLSKTSVVSLVSFQLKSTSNALHEVGFERMKKRKKILRLILFEASSLFWWWMIFFDHKLKVLLRRYPESYQLQT